MTDQERLEEMLADAYVMEVLGKARFWIDKEMTVIWKWTCSRCAERVASDQLNDLYAIYIHEDCGGETKTIDGDIGFAVMFQTGGKK